MFGLPESEIAAHQCLELPDTYGNWQPSAATTVANACIRHGIGEDDYISLISLSPMGRLLRDAHSAHVPGKAAKLETFLRKQYAWAEDNPRDDGLSIQEQAERLALRVLWADCWPDNTTRSAALALATVAIERGAYSFDCSVRWLAVLIGVADQMVASKARTALCGLGLIEVTGKARELRRVKLDLRWRGQEHYKQSSRGSLFVVGLSHDVFTRRGFGPVAGWLWVTLCLHDEPMLVTELASKLHVSTRTVERHLKKLVEYDVVKSSSNEFVGIPDADLDVVAERIGAAGFRDSLRDKFAPEQAANRQQRLDWYSAKVKAADEYNRHNDEWMAALATSMAEQTRGVCETRTDPRTIPDPFDPNDTREPVCVPARTTRDYLNDPWAELNSQRETVSDDN